MVYKETFWHVNDLVKFRQRSVLLAPPRHRHIYLICLLLVNIGRMISQNDLILQRLRFTVWYTLPNTAVKLPMTITAYALLAKYRSVRMWTSKDTAKMSRTQPGGSCGDRRRRRTSSDAAISGRPEDRWHRDRPPYTASIDATLSARKLVGLYAQLCADYAPRLGKSDATVFMDRRRADS